MMKPKVSVIITVHNIEQYIGECIESVLSQSMRDLELICIDDASTDGSLEIVKNYAEKDARIKVIAQAESVGPSTARNIGYRVAQGEYVYQIDGDDYIVEDALMRMYTCAKENELDLLTFSAMAFADSKEIEKKVHHLLNLYMRTGVYDGIRNGIELFAELTHNSDFHGNLCCIFVNKDFFNKNNLYLVDGLYASADSPFLIYLKAQRTMCIPDALYMRRFRENSIVTSKKSLIKFESILVQFLYEFDLWKGYAFEEKIEKELNKYFALNWRRVLKTYHDVADKNAELKLLPYHKGAKFVFHNIIKGENTYWTNQTSQAIEEIKQYKNVIIYGAKDIAKEVKTILDQNEINHYIFAVSDNTNEKEFEDKPIYCIEELAYMKDDAIVIVAVSKRHQESIKENLHAMGFENILVAE